MYLETSDGLIVGLKQLYYKKEYAVCFYKGIPMKFLPLLIPILLFSCGSGSKPAHLKNIKPGKLEFFETYTMSEILPSWEAACNWVNTHDTLVLQGKVSLSELKSRGLSALVHPISEYTVGYVKKENRSKVDETLHIPAVKACFPKDLKFIWSYGLEDDPDGGKSYFLYAIRVPSGNKAPIGGAQIETAESGISQYDQTPIIKIAMNKQGAHDWEIMTAKNVGRSIAIVFDGQAISCPVVNGAISGGVTDISGNFTKARAEELAARIDAGIK